MCMLKMDLNEVVGATSINSLVDDASSVARESYDLAVSEPLVSVAVLILVLSVGAIGTHYVINSLRNVSDEMMDVLSDCEDITILMHNNPDPDAMACAMAVQRMAQKAGTESEIVYPGRISHDENRAFRAVLDVSFRNIDRSDQITGEKIVVVDHVEPRGLEDSETVVPDIVLDHHSSNGGLSEEQVDFWHVNEECGSCAAILTDFLAQQEILTDGSEDALISPKLSTALYHGIKSDTNDLSQGVSELDFKSINRLYSHIDSDKLHRISNPKADDDALETKARAIMGRDVRGPFAVSDVGEVQNTDAIPQAADELIRLEGISAAVIIGTTDGTIRMSGRAYDDRIHLGEALRRAVEDIPDAGAGGHAEMAGGSIPKDSINSTDINRSDVIEKLFDVMNGKQ